LHYHFTIHHLKFTISKMALTEIKIVTPPAVELALATVKGFLRIDFTDDDSLLTTLIQSSRERAEQYCNTGSITGQKGKSDREEALNWSTLWAQSSRAGLSYSDFWKMTPNEWSAWMDGFMLREEDEWRRLRVIYALIYNTHVDRHHQMKPEELMPLQSDLKNETGNGSKLVRYLTEAERNVLKQRYKLK